VTIIFFWNALMQMPMATMGLRGFLKSMMNLCLVNLPKRR
jgi:hypothetical protein